MRMRMRLYLSCIRSGLLTSGKRSTRRRSTPLPCLPQCRNIVVVMRVPAPCLGRVMGAHASGLPSRLERTPKLANVFWASLLRRSSVFTTEHSPSCKNASNWCFRILRRPPTNTEESLRPLTVEYIHRCTVATCTPRFFATCVGVSEPSLISSCIFNLRQTYLNVDGDFLNDGCFLAVTQVFLSV